MGAQDGFSQAQEFRESTGTLSFTMIWDESFQSWSYYGVGGQPAALLVNTKGEPIQGWLGAFPEDEVLDLARAA